MNAEARVALVDDEEPVRIALGRVLAMADLAVTMFASGEEFLGSLDAELPDCLILDVHLPGLSGFDVMAHLHTARAEIPVILITGSDMPEMDERARRAGALALLRKPFARDELLAAIRDALGRMR